MSRLRTRIALFSATTLAATAAVATFAVGSSNASPAPAHVDVSPTVATAKAAAKKGITINGAVEERGPVSRAELEDFTPRAMKMTYQTSSGPQTHRYTGPLLLDVLNSVEPNFSSDDHDPLRFVILVKATDGFLAALAWGEIEPELANKRAIIALTEDGKKLEPPAPGPARRPSRRPPGLRRRHDQPAPPQPRHGQRRRRQAGEPRGRRAQPLSPRTPTTTGEFMSRSSRFRRSCVVVAALALALPLAACSDDDDDVASPSGQDTPAPSSKELVVFAAASLTGSFTELGETFESAHPGVSVTFNFGSSGTLATQINEGAPADVFASASPATMKTVTDAGQRRGLRGDVREEPPGDRRPDRQPRQGGRPRGLHQGRPRHRAVRRHRALRSGGGQGVRGGQDHAQAGHPGGRRQGRADQGRGGEVDAALVYHTDVLSATDGKVEGIEFDESDLAINDYLISALKESDEPDLAADWVEFVQTDEAQDVLVEAGFESADGSSTATSSATPSSTSTSSTSSEDDEDEESTEPSESPTATSTP